MFDWLLSLFRPQEVRCKNCGRPLRGLVDAPEIPIHVDTESRWCGTPRGELPEPAHWAEWPDGEPS